MFVEANLPQRILPAATCRPYGSHRENGNVVQDLYDIQATRRIEAAFAARLPAHTLMRRAGLSVARLAMALHPHAETFWIACGPGNNGGDGLEAASNLKQWGKQVVVTWLGSAQRCSADTLAAYERARQSGVQFDNSPPGDYAVAIDALLGIGASSGSGSTDPGRIEHGKVGRSSCELNDWADRLNQHRAPVLSIDLPSGLNADTGVASPHAVRAHHTLSLVTLKPGLFTAAGRDCCGEIWHDAAGCDDLGGLVVIPAARLSGWPAFHASTIETVGPESARAPQTRNTAHAFHKGNFGDVVVIGGAPGMAGAALLAAGAALHGGAGRVLVGLLDGGLMTVDVALPELMIRPVASLDLRHSTVVCGCGGGDAVKQHLHAVLSTASLAVLDADALNAIAVDLNLQLQLKQRAARNRPTVLTPHPLEAARLLGRATNEVQADRLAAAHQLAERFACCVVLKGSGSVIATPGRVPHINTSGNALLATAGTGDVLAGLIAGRIAPLIHVQTACADTGAGAGFEKLLQAVFQAVCGAVFRHGEVADSWPDGRALTASALARAL